EIFLPTVIGGFVGRDRGYYSEPLLIFLLCSGKISLSFQHVANAIVAYRKLTLPQQIRRVLFCQLLSRCQRVTELAECAAEVPLCPQYPAEPVMSDQELVLPVDISRVLRREPSSDRQFSLILFCSTRQIVPSV